jgi:hypothetical protein
MSDDHAKLFNSLRASTVALLGYDVDNLTAAQKIRVDRAIALRLVIDDAQAKQMRGEAIDVRAFVAASESLERMCGGNPETAAAGHDFSGAREELRRFLAGRAAALEHRAQREAEAIESSKYQDAPLSHGTTMVPKFGEANPDPAGSDESDSGVPHPPPSPLAAGGCEPAPPQQTSPQPPLPKDGEIPRHWLRDGQPREAWRDHIGPSGEIISPWFNPHG